MWDWLYMWDRFNSWSAFRCAIVDKQVRQYILLAWITFIAKWESVIELLSELLFKWTGQGHNNQKIKLCNRSRSITYFCESFNWVVPDQPLNFHLKVIVLIWINWRDNIFWSRSAAFNIFSRKEKFLIDARRLIIVNHSIDWHRWWYTCSDSNWLHESEDVINFYVSWA